MKHTRLAAIVTVAIMTLSVCGVAGVTTSTKAQAATPTKTTLDVYGKSVLGGIYRTRGTVTTSTGLPVVSGGVAIYRQAPGETSRTYWKTVPVVGIRSPQPIGHKPGTFSFDDKYTKVGTVYYSAYYLGWPNTASQYATSWSGVKSTVVKYRTTVKVGFISPGRSASGTLTYLPYSAPGAGKWEPLGNQNVDVYKKGINDKHWTWFKKAKTDTNGKWSVSTAGQPLKTEYAAWYKGDATHWPAFSVFTLREQVGIK